MRARTVTGSEVATELVTLVGGGPGHPDFLTLRAEALLAAAATVVVDAGLVHLAGEFAPTAAVVTVSDRRAAVDVLLAATSRGPVVRLYAGDTWLHPGHGPESAALAAAGIAFEAVAGVATEIAVPALAGIAVHVRHLAIACTIADAGHAPLAGDPGRTLVLVVDNLEAADPAAVALPTAGAGGLLVTGAVTGMAVR
ncbi:MAG: uroporphyrin-III C-methyltransferase [Actinomycetota bacterium]|nr:uroporphyrin-III C-methyltransferase [Actinomycetota bacterium]